MNEKEWLTCKDPRALIEFVRRLPEERIRRPEIVDVYSQRKMRLLACAIAWRIHGNSPVLRANILRAEAAIESGDGTHDLFSKDPAYLAADEIGVYAQPANVMADLADLVRDTFTPWRPVTLPRGWLTADVVSLAEAAYEYRLDDGTLDPDRLAVLSDALVEAGCAEVCGACRGTRQGHDWNGACGDCEGVGYVEHDLLTALRSPGPHCRGFWPLDLVLGKP